MMCLILQLFFHMCVTTTIASVPTRPNIIFILADDLGWDDVGFHGSEQIPTPNIDTLAYDGIILTNYYVQPVCTPSRGALMTGRHPIHTGLFSNGKIEGDIGSKVDSMSDIYSGARPLVDLKLNSSLQHWVIEDPQPYGLPLNETLMPQYLKELGYKTHMIGKWHLGMYAVEYTPTRRGFDSHYGYFQAMGGYWDHTSQQYGRHKYQDLEQNSENKVDGKWGLDFRRNDDIVKTDFGRYSTELFAAEAERIIQQHDLNTPLFLYLPFQAVHSANPWRPLEAPHYYYEKMAHIKDDSRRIFAAMVSALDDAVGNVTSALHKKAMLDNSIIVFSTDNGGPAAGFNMNHASNAPLRGTKAGLWEGGVRGTAFIWSPLLCTSPHHSDVMMQVTDWLPTLLKAAGYDTSKLPSNLDGLDLWEFLNNTDSVSVQVKQAQQKIRTEILHNIDPIESTWAVRVEDMKLIYAEGDVTRQWDKWYQPDGVNQMQTYGVPDRFTSYDSNYKPHNEAAPSTLSRSTLHSILKEIGRQLNKSSPFIINCGPRPSNASTNCKVWEKPCLYNITADPCEYNNIADQLPNMVNQLLTRLQEYNHTAVPPRNKPADPAAYPMYHGGLWVPWIKLNN